MYVCVCKAVKSCEVEAAIDAGAATVGAVTRACGAGGDCGMCHATIDAMIEQRDARTGVRSLRVLPPRAA